LKVAVFRGLQENSTMASPLRLSEAEESVMRKWNSEQGMSLIEATIILMVLGLLTAVLSPAMGDYVNDARDVKVKEDVEAIGLSIMRTVRDSRTPFLQRAYLAGAPGLVESNRADMIVGEGAIPGIATAINAGFTNGNLSAPINWGDAVGTGTVDAMANHLITNAANYPVPSQASFAVGGPQFGAGWRGAYISAIGPDPWGNRYAANTAFLGVATDSAAAGEGNAAGGWTHDVIVLSSGRDSIVQTPFGGTANGGSGAGTANDDVFYTVTGTSR
jgi:type II secretory pathway pseudopilin PulG